MKVKKYIIIIIFTFICLPVFSQTSSMGIKGGLNIANLYIDDIVDESSEVGFQTGFYGKFPVHPNLYIQPEILYTQKGANAFLEDQKVKIELNYIELPVFLKLKLKNYFNIHGGPYVSYLLAHNVELENQNPDLITKPDEDNFKNFDFGFLLGMEFNIGKFDIGIRYNSGIIKVGKNGFASDLEGLNNAINNIAQFYLAYRLL